MFGAGRSVGGVNVWTRGGPEGGSIAAIVPDPTDDRVLYLGTGGGVFKSTDGGAHWTAVNEGIGDTSITALTIRGDEPSTLFAGTRVGRLYRTSNSGGNWSELARPTEKRITSVVYDATSGSLYAAADTSVFRSDDGAATWQTFDRLSYVTFIAVPFGGAVYAGSESGLSVSRDRGATWESVSGVQAAHLNAMAADPETGTLVVSKGQGNGEIVFRSTDRGKTWQALPTLVSGTPIITLFIDGPKVLASTYSGLYEIIEGATAWQLLRVASGDPVVSIGKSSSRSGPLFAGTQAGLLKKTEGDTTFTYSTDGLAAANTSDVKVIAANPLQAFVATLRGLYKTTDGAQTWQAVALPQSAAGTGNPAAVRRVAPSSTSETVFASRDDGLLRSTDTGESWKLVLGQRDLPSAIAIAPSEISTVYAALTSAMSKSTNGGETWTPIMAGIPLDDYFFWYGFSSQAIAVHPTNPETVFLAHPSGIFKTVDGGGMWWRVYEIADKYKEWISALVIDSSDPSIVYAGLYRGVVKSIDAGVTWSRMGLDGEAVRTLAIDPAHPSVIYAGTARGQVFRSANRGEDWALFDLGMHGASVASLAISPSGDLLYAATSGGVFTYQRDRRYLDGAVTYAVALRTYHSNYLSAAHCGDREVNGAAASVGPCETFTLYDVNGGVLMDGDTVYLQAPNGSFVVAENGGAGGCIGCESPLSANRAVAGHWETFTIHRAVGAGRIADGDAISLQAYRRDFVAAEPDGRVNANRVVPREWETFILMMR